MEIKIDVNLKSPELMAAILALAEALSQSQKVINIIDENKNTLEVENKANKEELNPENREIFKKEEIKSKTVTLEEVRAVLARKSQGGKQTGVKALIKEFGANKLTDIDSCNYKELMEKAELL